MSDIDNAAANRSDYVRALKEEREACERAGKPDRVKAIDAELRRVSGAPQGRSAEPSETVEAKPSRKRA
jgi:hypothetical protein